MESYDKKPRHNIFQDFSDNLSSNDKLTKLNQLLKTVYSKKREDVEKEENEQRRLKLAKEASIKKFV